MIDPLSATKRTFYLHVPKTGGITLRRFIDQQFYPTEICPAYDFVQAQTDEQTQTNSAQWRLIRGHYFFEEYSALFPPADINLITMRHPDDRLLSAYWQARVRPGHPRHIIAREMELLDYVNAEQELKHALTNTHVRMLACPHSWTYPVTDSHLHLALERLHRFEWVGILEHFAESILVLCYRMGWRPPRHLETANANPHQGVDALPNAIQTALHEKNTLDWVLYEAALRRHQRDFLAMCQILSQHYGTVAEQTNAHQIPLTQVRDWVDKHYRQTLFQQRKASTWQIHMDDRPAIFGEGWHPPETIRTGETVRWTGPETRAVLDIALASSQSYTVRLHVRMALQPATLDQIGLCVNGHEVPLYRQTSAPTSVEFLGHIQPSMLDNQMATRLEILSPVVTRPCDLQADNPDTRHLGFQIAWVNIQPG